MVSEVKLHVEKLVLFNFATVYPFVIHLKLLGMYSACF
jgi:hypothetical protein